MESSRRRVWRSAHRLIVPLLVLCSACDRASADVIDEILRNLANRFEATKTISYTLAGTQITPNGSLIDGAPKEDHIGTVRATLKADFGARLLYSDLAHEEYYAGGGPKSGFVSVNSRTYYDGSYIVRFGPMTEKIRQNFRLNDENPNVTKVDAATGGGYHIVGTNFYPLAVYHGIVAPKEQQVVTLNVFSSKSLGRHLERKLLADAGRAKQGASECVVLAHILSGGQKGHKAEHWFDSTKDWSVVRIDYYTPQGVLYSSTKIEPRRVSWGWIPERWTSDFYAMSGSNRLRSTLKEEVIDFAINDSLPRTAFEAEAAKPGDIIEERKAKSNYFKVDANGDLQRVLPGTLESQAKRSWSPWLAWVTILVVAFSLVLAYHLKRANVR